MQHLELVTLVVREYDPAIEFFVNVLGFQLVEDSLSTTNDGRPKRWVVVRPRGAQTGILLARADGDRQASIIGAQFAGRVGFFLRVDDFNAAYDRLASAGVEFVTGPRDESYGRVPCSGILKATGGTCLVQLPIEPREHVPRVRMLSRRAAIAALVTVALATAIHLDWHFARPATHHLSLGLTWHWLMAIPVFALVVAYVVRAWPGHIVQASIWIVAGAVALGGMIEPAWEYFLEGATRDWAFGPLRTKAILAYVSTGLIAYVVTLILMRRR